MSETTQDRSARYRAETERAVALALHAEYRLRIADLQARIQVWEARIRGLES